MGWYIYETVKNLKMRKKQTHMGVKNKQWHPVRNLMLFLLTVVRLYLNWPPKFKEIWGRGMVTDISDVVHGEPVPLILPHPGLPVHLIGSFLFVCSTNYCLWALSMVLRRAMLWMNCSILACIPQYRNSTCHQFSDEHFSEYVIKYLDYMDIPPWFPNLV